MQKKFAAYSKKALLNSIANTFARDLRHGSHNGLSASLFLESGKHLSLTVSSIYNFL